MRMTRYRDWAPTAYDRAGLNGDREGIAEWFVVLLRHRDSDCLAESNFAAALNCLGGESESVEVHRFRHWQCGWFELIVASPDREADAKAILERLAEYPILDEEDHSRRELDAAAETWAACFSVRERIQWMRERRCEPAESFADLRAIVVGDALPQPQDGDLSRLIY